MPDETRSALDEPDDGEMLHLVDAVLAALPDGPSAGFEARVRARARARRAQRHRSRFVLATAAALAAVVAVTVTALRRAPVARPAAAEGGPTVPVPSPPAAPSPADARAETPSPAPARERRRGPAAPPDILVEPLPAEWVAAFAGGLSRAPRAAELPVIPVATAEELPAPVPWELVERTTVFDEGDGV